MRPGTPVECGTLHDLWDYTLLSDGLAVFHRRNSETPVSGTACAPRPIRLPHISVWVTSGEGVLRVDCLEVWDDGDWDGSLTMRLPVDSQPRHASRLHRMHHGLLIESARSLIPLAVSLLYCHGLVPHDSERIRGFLQSHGMLDDSKQEPVK